MKLMIGVIQLFRRLLAAKRQRTRRITIIESARLPPGLGPLGPLVAQVMGWRYFAVETENSDGFLSGPTDDMVDVVISRSSPYQSSKASRLDADGLTVAIDDVIDDLPREVCDLSSSLDCNSLRVEYLRRIMLELGKKGGRR
jgi:hypothetical protein